MRLLLKFSIVFHVIFRETKSQVTWNLDTSITESYEPRIGRSVRLNCTLTGQTCCPNSDIRQWSVSTGGTFTPVITNGASTDTSKYEEDLQTTANQFNLIIKKFDIADTALQYRCQYQFSTDDKSLQMSDGLHYIPTTNDISVISSSFDSIYSFSYSVNITNVYPQPDCSCIFGGDDLTANMTTTVGDNGALKYAVLSLSNVAHKCSGEFRITCNIGSYDNQQIVALIPCGSGTDGKSCEEPLIYVLFFILTLVCVATTFFPVIWFNLRFHKIGKVALIIIGVVVDLLFEIILLWGIEYGSDFKLFKSDINCRVVIIGVICHVVAVVIEIVKAVVQYLYIKELGVHIFVCYRQNGKIKEVRKSTTEEHPSNNLLPDKGDGRKSPSADNQSKTLAKPEDIMLFMHFTVPLGYTVNKWVTEENASIENNPKYVSNDRGTLLIKSATERDNGIYQGILTSDGNEQRVNAVLHVTGQKSANLIINPLIWRQVKTKKLKKISDLKEIRHKVSRNDMDSIPMKNEEESNVKIMSIRWEHNGKINQNSSEYKDGDGSVPPLTVTKHQPIDEYHCTVDFTNNKSHVYIFIVKFTGVRSGNTPQSTAMHNNKVDTVEDVVGVPTILRTRREERTSSLPPLRHTATTPQDRHISNRLLVDENNLHPVTARSSQSTGPDDNL